MVQTLSDHNYKDILLRQPVAVVKVYANWCGPCKFMTAYYKRWSNIFSNVDGVDIPFYEVENDNNPDFIKNYKITNLPSTLIMVYGVPVFVIVGVTKQEIIEKSIKQALTVKVERSNANERTGNVTTTQKKG